MNRPARKRLTTLFASLLAGFCLQNAGAAQVETAYTTANRYDVAGQLTGTIAPDPDAGGALRYRATRNIYNSRGLIERTESGELTTWLDETIAPSTWGGYGFTVLLTKEYGYDSYGRRITESLKGADGTVESVEQFSYDTYNRVLCKAVRLNKSAFSALPANACDLGTPGSLGPDRVTRFTYDLMDQVLTEERAVGTDVAETYVTNTYKPQSRLMDSQTDANGNRTELRYDTYGRLYRRVYPSAAVAGTVNEGDYTEYTYDNNGNVRVERKRSGDTITDTWDATNQLIVKDLSDNTYSSDVFFDYDLRGLQLAARYGGDSGQGISNAFDGFGRLASSTVDLGGVARTIGLRYDANGNKTRITHPDGYFFTYGYDGLDRVNSLSESTAADPSATSTSLLTLSYRPVGSRSSIVRAGASVTTTTTPDNAQRLGSIQQNFAGTSSDLTNSFEYNPAGQITLLTQSNAQYVYTDSVNQSGNYTSNGLNQYSDVSGFPLGYDTNGNLTGGFLSNGTALSFTYDMENRLVATSGAVVSTLSYDPLGRLSQAVIAGTTTRFLYDGDDLVSEYNGSNALTRRYVHGDGEDEPWVQYNGTSVGSSARRYLHADHHGSIVALSDNSGAVLNKLAYDSFGVPASANTGRFGYTGQAWLPALELYYYKARMYAPLLGRFMQVDPVGDRDDYNLYTYVYNDPLNRTDPTGLCGEQEDPCPGWGGGDYDQQVSNYEADLQGAGSEEAKLVGSYVPVIGQLQSLLDAGMGVSRGQYGMAAVAATGLLSKKADAVVKTGKKFYSYTIRFASGKTYDGKGIGARVMTSIKRLQAKFKDKAVSAKLRTAKSENEALKQEHRGMERNGGAKSPANYNERNSPGKKLCETDKKCP